jgi:hypothetical protein
MITRITNGKANEGNRGTDKSIPAVKLICEPMVHRNKFDRGRVWGSSAEASDVGETSPLQCNNNVTGLVDGVGPTP